MEMIIDEGRVYGVRYYTVQPQVPEMYHQVQQTCEAYDLLHPSSTHPTDEMKESREKAIALAMAQAAPALAMPALDEYPTP